MTPGAVRRALHAAHSLTSVLLIATGLLLWDPDLRARLVGGYGRQVLDGHLWIGWVFLAAPIVAVVVAARPILRDLARRLGPPDPPFAWRKVHIVASLAMTFLLGASGLVLWVDLDLPIAALDAALEVHLAATWLLTASIPVHLVVARRQIVARTRGILGLVPESELRPPFFDEDGP
ncbi:MAG: cytochrome b/b6 domain-containing protein [Myxococcales bacterium]|nr:cytochrome b/b6 domain-containing protein [Myxococcales bacterium]